MNNLRDILLLGRLHFVLGGFLLYTLGFLLALSPGYVISLHRFMWGYSILLFAHLSVSYSNDFFDAEEDRIAKPRIFSGGSGVLVRRPDLKNTAEKIATYLMVLSVISALGFMLYYQFSILLLVYVLLGNACGWYYSAPPLRLSHKMYGNIILALTAAILVPWFGNYIASETITLDMLLFSVPLLFYGCVFSIGVQIPDYKVDRLNLRRNFVSVFGVGVSYQAIFLLCFVSSVYFYFVSCLFQGFLGYGLVSFFSLLPLASSIYSLLETGKDVLKAELVVSSVFLFVVLCDVYLFIVLQ